MSVFDRFKSQGKNDRSHAEEPTAQGTFISKNDGSAPELYDFSLIDQTVNEWLEQPDSITVDDATAEMQNVSRNNNLDRVLDAALQDGIISADEIQLWQNKYNPEGKMDWRFIARTTPSKTQPLQRLAAEIYGFRPVLVCQMSTLVLADLLTSRLSPLDWQHMFERGLAPVVEHGSEPDLSARIVCISKDPSHKSVRQSLASVDGIRSELAYADTSVVSGVQELIAQNIPAVAASVYTTRPQLRKITSDRTDQRRAA